jgi:hypothetical protein
MKVMDREDKLVEVGTLKPCLFCGNGSDIRITSEKTFNELCQENGSSLVEISCTACNCALTQYSVPDNNYSFGMGMLVQRWNSRKG